ncbi:nucleotide exchange factor GrpE [Buchnera aphidicola (Melanaphis sacchari)]|uniref:Protein GrpE n=1 Tax=Buchnera aphidicola (Melanaphis sacchari) TaxID=2173854 RepID=A0A2U8DFE2_9GAMM|nr:nucleotide exchange factor GrpE [Buchnera aphidicola]AWH90530.1 nucleotide exchange factor GrpE [Buchnera aphidicola (Melanaphis sacchari)]
MISEKEDDGKEKNIKEDDGKEKNIKEDDGKEKNIKEMQEKIKSIELSNIEEISKLYTRMNNDIEKVKKFSLEKIIIEFLPIIDSIERALDLLKKEESKIYIECIKNIEYVFSLLNEVLNEFNISKVNKINIPFNPEIHQAMSISYTDKIPCNQVVEVMQSGYILHQSRLLRPAMVVVSKEKGNFT